MGDHRQDSLDSRYHQNLPGGGTVSDDEVVGRAFVMAWPVNRWATLPVPDTFDQPGINAARGAVGAGLAGCGPVGAAAPDRWIAASREGRLTGTRRPGR